MPNSITPYGKMAQLHGLGQGEVDGCSMVFPHERRRPVLQGVGGDAVSSG